MDAHHTVTQYLRNLRNEELVELGLELGLHYPRLKNMAAPAAAELVAVWLHKKDDVLATSGVPSWTSLVTKLQDISPVLAVRIRKGLQQETRECC